MNDCPESMTRRAGFAAVLAFLDIALCGYHAYMVLLVFRAPLELIMRPDILGALAAPTAFAALAYCPTDALTRVLGKAARVASLGGLAACLLAVGRILAEQSAANASVSAVVTLLGGFIAGAHFAAFFCHAITSSHPVERAAAMVHWPAFTPAFLYAIGVVACALALIALPPLPFLAAFGVNGREFFQKRFTEALPLAVAELTAFLAIIAGVPLLIASSLPTVRLKWGTFSLFPILGVFWFILSVRWAGHVPGFGLLTCLVGVILAGAALVMRCSSRGSCPPASAQD